MDHAQRSQPTEPERDGLTIAFELVFTPAVVGAGGYLLDRWLGTSPIFTIALTLVALVTVVSLTIWRYNNEIHHLDAERRAAQAARGPGRARWEHDEAAAL